MIMKKVFLFAFILLSFAINAQSTPSVIKSEDSSKNKWIEYISLSDVVKSEKGWYRIKDKTITVKNGKKQDISANFSVSFEDYEPTANDIDMINIDMETILMMTKFKLKNPSSFSPFDISFYRSSFGYKAYIKYTAKNDYGGEKDGMEVFKFDLKGIYQP